jgi:hypothetical protein
LLLLKHLQNNIITKNYKNSYFIFIISIIEILFRPFNI